VPWLTLEEAVSIICFVLETNDASGPINAVSPAPVRNTEFTSALAHALHRPAFLPVPALALRLTLGEMARPLLLASQRVIPSRLSALGYRFLHPELPAALAAALSPSGSL
jgi:NAD dependent epimerase/dehydratase family enzyme